MIIRIVPAVGCETLKDGTSVMVLNQTKQCQDKSECLGEKEINVDKKVTNCSLLPSQAQYLNKDGWQTFLGKASRFDVVTSGNKILLKVFNYDLCYLENLSYSIFIKGFNFFPFLVEFDIHTKELERTNRKSTISM